MIESENDKRAENKFESKLDCTGMNCPLPLIKTSQHIKKLSPGSILEVISTDPRSKDDLSTWARQTGNEMVKTEENESMIRFYIRKKNHH